MLICPGRRRAAGGATVWLAAGRLADRGHAGDAGRNEPVEAREAAAGVAHNEGPDRGAQVVVAPAADDRGIRDSGVGEDREKIGFDGTAAGAKIAY